jgi:hypothetical protein
MFTPDMIKFIWELNDNGATLYKREQVNGSIRVTQPRQNLCCANGLSETKKKPQMLVVGPTSMDR